MIDVTARQEQSQRAALVFFEDFDALVEEVGGYAPSALVALNRSYPRHLVVAAASSLEAMVKMVLPDIFRRLGREEFGVFVEKNVVSRGYHQLFDWKAEKATSFFAMFGDECKRYFLERLAADAALNDQHAAFMRIGSIRNQLVHNDYATVPIEMTPNEVRDRFLLGARFVSRLESLILKAQD